VHFNAAAAHRQASKPLRSEALCDGCKRPACVANFMLNFQYLIGRRLLRFCNGWPKKQRRTENPLA
jgi:hypothetical protein